MKNKTFRLKSISKIISNNNHIGYNLIGMIKNTNWYICLISGQLYITKKDLKILDNCTVSQLNKYYNKIEFLVPNSLLYYLSDAEPINKHNSIVESNL